MLANGFKIPPSFAIRTTTSIHSCKCFKCMSLNSMLDGHMWQEWLINDTITCTLKNFLVCFFMVHTFNVNTVEPHYKNVGYKKGLLWQGNFAGPRSIYFFVLLPWYNKPDIRQFSWPQGPHYNEVPLYCKQFF